MCIINEWQNSSTINHSKGTVHPKMIYVITYSPNIIPNLYEFLS